MNITRRRAAVIAAGAPLALAARVQGAPAAINEIEHTDLAMKNAALVREHHDLLNKGNIEKAAEFYAEDTRNPGVPAGRKALVRVLIDIYGTFPDWKMGIEELAAVGDDVIIRCIVTGTHKGVGKIPVNGGLLVGVPPTGSTFKVQHIHWLTLKEGLIVEHRANRDDVGMMQQLGLLPAVKRYDLPDKVPAKT